MASSRRRPILIALFSLFVTTGAIAPSVAEAASADKVVIDSSAAKLENDNQEFLLNVTYTCVKRKNMSNVVLGASAMQEQEDYEVAKGGDVDTRLTCDSKPHKTQLSIVASYSEFSFVRFKPGKATVSSELRGRNTQTNQITVFAKTSKTITLK